jgi:hypothetical protein
MKDYSPRPLIEEHYHIQELIDAQEKRAGDRQYHKDKEKERAERDEIIAEAKPKDVQPFWCNVCKEEFVAESIKEIETDWSNSNQRIAFYRTKCFKGHWCMRLITDRHKDAYWFRSTRVAQDRGKHYADTVQPYETGFNLLYGKPK